MRSTGSAQSGNIGDGGEGRIERKRASVVRRRKRGTDAEKRTRRYDTRRPGVPSGPHHSPHSRRVAHQPVTPFCGPAISASSLQPRIAVVKRRQRDDDDRGNEGGSGGVGAIGGEAPRYSGDRENETYWTRAASEDIRDAAVHEEGAAVHDRLWWNGGGGGG